MKPPMASIIMPVYNSEKFMSAAIESVLCQTYSDWELVIIDDGSSDHSKEIATKFSLRDQRITIVHNEQNLGIAKTRNRGIERVTGKYVAFLDSDDLWLPNKLEEQLAIMEKNNIDFSCSSYFVCDENGAILNERNFRKGFKTYKELLKTNTVGCLTVVVKTKIIKKHLMPCLKHEDYATWLNILKDNIDIYFIDEKLAVYRKRLASVSANKLNVIPWVWKILRENEQFSVTKSFFYLIRFLFYTTFKYAVNE